MVTFRLYDNSFAQMVYFYAKLLLTWRFYIQITLADGYNLLN